MTRERRGAPPPWGRQFFHLPFSRFCPPLLSGFVDLGIAVRVPGASWCVLFLRSSLLPFSFFKVRDLWKRKRPYKKLACFLFFGGGINPHLFWRSSLMLYLGTILGDYSLVVASPLLTSPHLRDNFWHRGWSKIALSTLLLFPLV